MPTSTATNPPLPTQTATITPEPTATFIPEPTDIIIPLQLAELHRLGYNKPSDDGFYVVVDESSVHFSDIYGIEFKGRIIRSWYEVHYFDESGVPQQAFCLGYVRGSINLNGREYTRVITSNSGQLSPNAPVEYIQFVEQAIKDMSPSPYPVYRAYFGDEAPVTDNLYDGLFPVVDGVPQKVNIPGIGLILPITMLELVDIPAQ